MATKYSTLTLEEEPRIERSRVKSFVLVGLTVFAVAGVATFGLSGQHVQSTVDSEFTVDNGDVAICTPASEGFLDALPKWDPNYAKSLEDLGNACYHSFRCCTEGESACNEEAQGTNTQASCTGCMRQHPSKMVDNRCRLFAQKKILVGPGNEVQCTKPFGGNQPDARCKNFANEKEYTDKDIKDGVVPRNLKTKFFQTIFRGMDSCWVQGGGPVGSVQRNSNSANFARTCYDVVGYCIEQQLCPEAGSNDQSSKTCKNCIATQTKTVLDSHKKNALQNMMDALKARKLRAEEKAEQAKIDAARKKREKELKNKVVQ